MIFESLSAKANARSDALIASRDCPFPQGVMALGVQPVNVLYASSLCI